MQWNTEAASMPLLRAEVPLNKDYSEIDGAGVFFDEQDAETPPIYLHWLHSFRARYEYTILAHLRQTYYPTVEPEDRYTWQACRNIPHAYRVLVRYGYNEHESSISAASNLHLGLVDYFKQELAKAPVGSERHQSLQTEYEKLTAALKKKEQPAYLFGRKDIQGQVGEKNIVRTFVVWGFSMIRDIMTSKPALWKLPAGQVVELGKAVII